MIRVVCCKVAKASKLTMWSEVLLLPTDAQENCFKKVILKFTLKQLQVPNSAAYIHQQVPDSICSHTTRLLTMMYFNKHCNFSKLTQYAP